MKKKFDHTNNTLGSIIQTARKEKGLSQEALGKLVGLGKSSISKIENGLSNISADDAAILLEAMGEKLQFYVSNSYPSMETKKQQIKFITIAVCWFSEAKNTSNSQAYNYLLRHNGIKFLEENFEYEQTFPKTEIIKDLTTICSNHIKQVAIKNAERRSGKA